MDAGFGGWAANHANRLAGAFAGTSIGLSSLAAHRQTAKMPDATVAFDALQAFEVHADFAPQVAFNDVLAVLDRMHDLRELLLRQIFGADAGVNIGLGQDVPRIARANAVDIPQRDVDALIGWNFNADNTSHIK